MSFSEALMALRRRNVKYVAREGWNGKGMFLFLQRPSGGRREPSTLPYIVMRTAQGDFVPWLASQTDVLSDDWVAVDPPQDDLDEVEPFTER